MKSLVWLVLVLGIGSHVNPDDQCDTLCRLSGFDIGMWSEKHGQCACVDFFSPKDLDSETLLVKGLSRTNDPDKKL